MAGKLVADALVKGFTGAVFQALTPLAQEKLLQFWGVHDIVEKLKRKLSMIESLVNDAETKQITRAGVREWMNNLRRVVYDLEDIVDEMNTEHLRLQVEKRSSTGNEVLDLLSFMNMVVDSGAKLQFNYVINAKITSVLDELNDISNDAANLGLREVTGVHLETETSPETSSFLSDTCVNGREDDTKRIIEFLLASDQESSNKNYSVIPIVGMGGLGKTTLAQIVYKDESLKGKFDVTIWVSVSENFDVKRVTKEIIESATSKECPNLSNMNVLKTMLARSLHGKKYLMVLDNVWTESEDLLQEPFQAGAKGSKIIITTRSEKVAATMGSVKPYRLRLLSDDHCWNVFRKKALGESGSCVAPNLEEIGVKIAKKCKGLPLAAKVLGGMLRYTRDEERWESILESEFWDIPEDKNGIFPALRLSYHYLPSHLKCCFEYCSLLPTDYKFVRHAIVLQWVAQGLVAPQRMRHLEDIGNEYFDELQMRSFFLMHRYGYYTMHDLLHALAFSVGSNLYFRKQDDAQSSEDAADARHFSLFCRYDQVEKEMFEQLLKDTNLRIRSFAMELPMNRATLPVPNLDKLMKFRCLRVLSLRWIYQSEIPESIGDLKQLRYLGLCGGNIETLPNSICNLYNLQSLHLELSKLIKLPKCMGNLISLRNLNTEECWRLKWTPPGLGGLTCLRHLNRYFVGKGSGEASM